MLAKKLQALGFLEWQKVDANSPEHIRKIVIWLEDQKIRRYKIKERQRLRDIQNAQWPNTLDQYSLDVGCTIVGAESEQLDWLLGHALWLEHTDDYERYWTAVEKRTRDKEEALKPSIKFSNPLDSLDFESNEFRSGVASMAKLLRVARHPDHLTTLEACSNLVRARVNPKGQNQRNTKVQSQSKNSQQRPKADRTLDAMEVAPGFNLKDRFLENAAKALVLLYIQDLRELQTKINETIVDMQSVTANPKTDTRLGKVGK